MPTRRRSRGDEDFLGCRTYNHAWERFSPIDLEAPWYGWRLSLRCIRCASERHDSISYGTGDVMGRRYIYAEGYQSEPGMGDERPTKQEFREELFTKLRQELRDNNALGEKEEKTNITPIKKAAKKKAAAAKKTNGGTRKRA